MYKMLALFATVGYLIPVLVDLIPPSYVYSSSPQPPFDETQESNMISTTIETANLHVQDVMRAIQQNDSSGAMRYLEELQYDLSNINSNVTNLLFTVTSEPP